MPRRTGARLTAIGLVLAITVSACSAAPPPAAPAIELDRGACGTDWPRPHGGDQTLTVHNASTASMEVQLVDPATHGVYAEVEQLGPGTSRPMRVVLAAGTYAFTCFPDGADAETGPSVTISGGPARGTPAVLPVGENDLLAAVRTYRKQVLAGLGGLAGNVTALRAAVRSGDRGRARAAWLTAQMAYGRLGAAYGTFGDLADAIDGLPAGTATDPGFTGLRRVEYGLWHDEPLPVTAKVTDRLATDVARLRAGFAQERTDPNDLPLRAHEILENALQFELTGDADQGSGTGLATLSANLDGTAGVLNAIAPVLRPRYPEWAHVVAELAATKRLVDTQHVGGRWTPPPALTIADHERLDGSLGQLLEDLAPIAAAGEVRREF